MSYLKGEKYLTKGKGQLCISRMSKPKWEFGKSGGNHAVKHLDEEAGIDKES